MQMDWGMLGLIYETFNTGANGSLMGILWLSGPGMNRLRQNGPHEARLVTEELSKRNGV